MTGLSLIAAEITGTERIIFDEDEVGTHLPAYIEHVNRLLENRQAAIRPEFENYFGASSAEGGFVSYDSNTYMGSFAYSMMMTRTGNCAHFSSLLAVLLGHPGYDCRLIPGEFINNNGSRVEHKWNYVLVNGIYYWLDVRIDHAAYSGWGVPHNYFMQSSKTVWEKSLAWNSAYTDALSANGGKIMNLYDQVLTMPFSSGISGLENFVENRSYTPFSDVAESEWYARYVEKACEIGLVKGMSETEYAPNKNIRLSECIALAARLHNIYYGGSGEFDQNTYPEWYEVYVRYAVGNNLVGVLRYDDYNRMATRAEFAMILAYALPEAELTAKNTVTYGQIPDVPMSAEYAGAVYRFYRAGVLQGSDANGNFEPDRNISRAEVATILVRMVRPESRLSVALS